MKFGDNLQNLRKAKKMSQEELAEKVEVSRQSISKWERGESYPTMNNIMTLCNIFHCNINDLVHESLTDINSLDEDIKMSVVKFKKEQQKKMKGISKGIYITSRIAKILVLVSICIMILVMIGLPIIISNTKIDDSRITFFGESFEYEVNNNTIYIKGSDVNVDDGLLDYFNNNSKAYHISSGTDIQEYFTSHSTMYYIISSEFIVICLILTLVVVYLILKNIEELFINIHNQDTPFTLENVKHIKKIALFLIISVFLPTITGLLFQVVTKVDMSIEFELMDIVFAIIVFSLSYIFQYGYEIQLDSKGKMYGDENE